MTIAKVSRFQNSFVEPSLGRTDGPGRAHTDSSQNSASLVLALNRLAHTEEEVRSEENCGDFPWFVGYRSILPSGCCSLRQGPVHSSEDLNT